MRHTTIIWMALLMLSTCPKEAIAQFDYTHFGAGLSHRTDGDPPFYANNLGVDIGLYRLSGDTDIVGLALNASLDDYPQPLTLGVSTMMFSSRVGKGFFHRYELGACYTRRWSSLSAGIVGLGFMMGVGYGWSTAGENNVLAQVKLIGSHFGPTGAIYQLHLSLGFLF